MLVNCPEIAELGSEVPNAWVCTLSWSRSGSCAEKPGI